MIPTRFFDFIDVPDLLAHLAISDQIQRCEEHGLRWVDCKRCGFCEDRNLFKLRNQ